MQHVPEPAVDASSGHESAAVPEDQPVASFVPAETTQTAAPDETGEPDETAETAEAAEVEVEVEVDQPDEDVPDDASVELDGFARDLDTVDAALEALDNDDLDAAEARVAELTTDAHADAATPADAVTDAPTETVT